MSRYRWTILALGTGAQAAYSAVFLGVPVIAPQLREDYGLSLTEVGLVIAATNGGSMLTLLPWGLLTDRVGERAVLTTGLVGASAALVGAAFAPSLAVLVLALTIAGGAGGSVNSASGRAVMSWFAATQRGFALGIRQTAVPLGGAAAALTLPPVADAGGTRAALLCLALACAGTALAGAVGLREAPAGTEDALAELGHPLRDTRIWRISVGSGILVAAQTCILAFTVLFLHGERGLSAGRAAAVLALVQILGAALRVVSGRWSDQLGRRVEPLLKLAFALAAALAVCAILVHAPLGLLLLALVVAGALSQSWNGLSFTATAEIAGRARSGAAIGLQQTALAVGGTATPPLFASVVEASSWRVGFGLAALLPLLAATVLRRVDV